MEELAIKHIENRIFTIRNLQVMLDRDLAELYQVETKVLNQAVKRNIERFPERFRFQLADNEVSKLVTNCDRFEKLKYSSSNPYAFTEQGVSMLSAVLRSDIAVQISVKIMDAFVEMRKFISTNEHIFVRLDRIEQKQLKNDENFDKIFKALERKGSMQEQGVFFNGQIFDAHKFVSDLIRKAQKSLVLIDNYVDDSTLTLFQKNQKVDVVIYTKTISKTLQLDVEKYNKQYKKITIKTNKNFHDRFLIIDKKEVYLIGASLKDLGKKVFGFSLLKDVNADLLELK